MTEIAPHVYIGGNQDAQDLDYLLSEGIKYVCVLGKYTEHAHPATLFHSKFNVEDHQGFNLASYFDEIFDYIDDCLDRGGKVLIHGPTGHGLASAIGLMYLMKGEGKTYNKAWYHLRSVYPAANPNSGFVRQLKALESELSANDSDFGKTRTFPVPPIKNSKNLATMRQPYEYTNNATSLRNEPANKYTFTRAPATVHYDVPRTNFTANATSLAHAPQENSTFTPSPSYPVSGNFYHHPGHDIPHEKFIERNPQVTTKFTPKSSASFYTKNLAKNRSRINTDFQGDHVRHDPTITLKQRKTIEDNYGNLGKNRALNSRVWTLKERGQGGDLQRDANRVVTISHNEIGRNVIERTKREQAWTLKEGQAEEWRKGDGIGIRGWRKRNEGYYGF